MHNEVFKEAFNELFSHLERLETQSEAILQFLKEKKRVTDKQLAPYLEQAGNASNVRWRAARVRIEHLLASAEKEEPKAAKKIEEKPPGKSSELAAQQEQQRQSIESPAGKEERTQPGHSKEQPAKQQDLSKDYPDSKVDEKTASSDGTRSTETTNARPPDLRQDSSHPDASHSSPNEGIESSRGSGGEKNKGDQKVA